MRPDALGTMIESTSKRRLIRMACTSSDRPTCPKVLVLDVDDTLYLERDYVRSGFNAVGAYVRQHFGVDDFDTACWDLFERGIRSTIFNDALRCVGLPEETPIIQTLVERYRTHEPEIQLLPDARALLAAARARGISMGVISDGPLAAQERKVRALGLESWVDRIILTDRWGRAWWKPHPRAFTEIERHFGVRGAECLYVGDNPFKDFVAPRALGWQSVRIRRDFGLNALHEGTIDARADCECRDLAELTRTIRRGAVLT